MRRSRKAVRSSMVRPDAVLFNGGFCIPAAARERIVEAIANWFGGTESGWRPRVLRSDAMGSAVAVGAAYYGRVRRGEGLRVKAGSARTYYIGTRTEGAAVCVLPAGTDEGTTLELNREFSVLANRPVSFNLFSSTVRHDATRGLGRTGPGTSASARATGDAAALWKKAATDGSGGAIVGELHRGWDAGTLVPIGQLATSMAVTVRIAG